LPCYHCANARRTRVLAALPTFASSIHRSPTMTDALDRSRPGDATADTAGPAPDGATLSSDPSTQPRGEPGSVEPAESAADGGRYQLGAELARGGLGRVLLARDRRLGGREVAVKQLIKPTPKAARRFRREALLTARLQHPGIVPLYDLGGADEPYYAMKLVAGRTFDRLIADARDRRGRLALLPHLIAVAEAIGYAHSQGVIHRDIKPANVLVGDFGETVVVDWGLAKLVRTEAGDGDGDRGGDGDGDGVSSELTAAGDVLGTPAYMAPEQAGGDPVDERADVYALGALLYHALSGVRPYQGPTGQSVLVQVAAGPPPPLASRAELAPDLVAIVERAMARDPAHRYRSGGELARELRRFQTGQLVEAHAYSPWLLLRRWLRRHRAPVAVAAVLLVALAASAAIGVAGVVRERNVAAGERDRARRRSEDLTIEQARAALARDPAAAIAWLAELGPAVAAHERAVAGVVAEAQARGVARHVVAAHARAVTAIELSSDSRTMVTAGDDGRARLWSLDGDRGPQLRAVLGHGAPLTRVALAADGGALATATQDGAVAWWDVAGARGELPPTAARPAWRHRGVVYALRLAGDGRLVTAGDDGAVWAGRRGQPPVRLAQHDGAVYAVAVSAGGLVAAGGVDGVVDLIAPEGPARRLDHGAAVVELAFSPDERWLATLCSDGAVRLWPTAGGAARVVGRLAAAPWDLAFAPAGDRLAVVDRGGALTVYDVATGAAEARRAHASAGLLVRWSADGAWIATGGDDSQVQLWGAGDGARWTLRGQRGTVQALAFSPDGRWLASGDQDGVVRLWPRPGERYLASALHAGVVRRIAVAAGGAVATAGADGAVWLAAPAAAPVRLGAHARSVDGLAIRADGGLVVSGDTGGELIVRGADGGARPLGREQSAITWLAMAPGGGAVAAATRDGTIGVWDLATGARRGLDGHAGMVLHAVFAADDVVVSGGVDGTVRRWSVAAATGAIVLRAPASVLRVAVAPDGAVASAGEDGSVGVWDASGGARIVHRHARTVSSVAFAPDGRSLVSASWDQTARLIPLAGGPSVDLVGHGEQVNAALFSPAGDAVVTVGDDGAARVWRLDGRVQRVLRAHDGFVLRVVVAADGTVVSGGADGALVRWSDPFRAAPAIASAAALDVISSARVGADRAARSP
jgi:WD40 repeat protein